MTHRCIQLLFPQPRTSLYTWLPLLARLVFASVLFRYFVNSSLTKFDGLFTPSVGAFVQIFPKSFEAVGYDVSQMPWFSYLVTILGGWAEFLLPCLLIAGLLTRPAAMGMIGFTIVMSLVDIYGHEISAQTAGMLFDAPSNGIIADQRLLWMLLFVLLAAMGGGKLSLDYPFGRWLSKKAV